MARNKFFSYIALYPISLCYGLGVSIRNWMFNHKILPSQDFEVPIISVGNIAMGGTGKTPHTEYIVEALRGKYNMAILSRGYKRKSKGFVLAGPESTLEDIGDEPLQMYEKYGSDVKVAVCESRADGIDELLENDQKLNMIILDDAFQHRYVNSTVSIVLTDFSRPVYEDHLLPFGKLREPMSAINRADIVIVTKCPSDISPIDTRLVKQHLNLYPFQKLFFSTFEYEKPRAVFSDINCKAPRLEELTAEDYILSLTGIENPRPFIRYLRSFKSKIKIKRYADHHFFTDDDFESIEQKFQSMNGKRKYIMTTEKDAMRLISNPNFPENLKKSIFYIPIKVKFIDTERKGRLEDTILQLIRNKKL